MSRSSQGRRPRDGARRPLRGRDVERVGRASDRDRDLLSSLIPTLTLACAARAERPQSFLRSQLSVADLDNCALELLTAREREVLDYLHLGFTNEQIGVALGTRPRTIRNPLTAVYRKLGVATRAEAVGLVASILHSGPLARRRGT